MSEHSGYGLALEGPGPCPESNFGYLEYSPVSKTLRQQP